jgi:hypothetical protein
VVWQRARVLASSPQAPEWTALRWAAPFVAPEWTVLRWVAPFVAPELERRADWAAAPLPAAAPRLEFEPELAAPLARAQAGSS